MQELAYYWEEEISCPKVSPLTLTGITRGPKNKRKEKPLVEEEREEAPRLEQNIEPTEEANEMLYLRIWDVILARQIDAIHVDVSVTALSLSPNMDVLATSHVDQNGVYLW